MTMADYQYVKDQDGGALWIKETAPIRRSAVSKFTRWLFPALTGVVLLILIIVLGTTSIKLLNRLCSVEQRLSNQSDIIQSLFASMQQGQDMKTSDDLLSVEQRVSNLTDVIKALNTSLEHAQETAKEVEQLQFAVENNKDQLTSVSRMLKKLSVIDSLSRSVAAIKCSLDLIINSSAAGGCCPLDWTAFDTSCYFFSRVALSWNDSRDWCETQQAHLATLHTDKEWEFVTHRTVPENFWVGLSDWRTGSWEWVDQTPYTVEPRRWKPGQPDNWAHHGVGPGNEDCAHLHNDGRLNDQHCSIKERFICQKNNLSA